MNRIYETAEQEPGGALPHRGAGAGGSWSRSHCVLRAESIASDQSSARGQSRRIEERRCTSGLNTSDPKRATAPRSSATSTPSSGQITDLRHEPDGGRRCDEGLPLATSPTISRTPNVSRRCRDRPRCGRSLRGYYEDSFDDRVPRAERWPRPPAGRPGARTARSQPPSHSSTPTSRTNTPTRSGPSTCSTARHGRVA